MNRLSASARTVAIGLSLLVMGLLAIQAAVAQEAVTVRLDPVGNSGVSGTATVRATGDDTAILNLEATGLAQGVTYRAVVQAGTCAMPSASIGTLGDLQADTTGRAALSTSTVRVSAAAVVDLMFSNLTDGDHIVRILDTGVVACGGIPASAAPGPSRLPTAGTPPAASLAPALAAVGLLGIGWGVLLRRR